MADVLPRVAPTFEWMQVQPIIMTHFKRSSVWVTLVQTLFLLLCFTAGGWCLSCDCLLNSHHLLVQDTFLHYPPACMTCLIKCLLLQMHLAQLPVPHNILKIWVYMSMCGEEQSFLLARQEHTDCSALSLYMLMNVIIAVRRSRSSHFTEYSITQSL